MITHASEEEKELEGSKRVETNSRSGAGTADAPVAQRSGDREVADRDRDRRSRSRSRSPRSRIADARKD